MSSKKINPASLRRIILEESKRAHVGHIASALSVTEIISVLYSDVLHIARPDDPERDRFVLSKGHAALALYAALTLKGFLTLEDLHSYCGDGSLLGVHPERDLVGVDFTTGSLGHGLSFAAGAALAARLDGSPRRTYALLSDAECNEGAVWEAAMFAAHHRLCNLTAVIDCNGQQALGKTADVLQMEPQAERWQSFGWRPIEVDGHDPVALQAAFAEAVRGESPSVVLARTSAGKGISFMEDKVEWHYLPMTDEQYASALNEVAADR